MPRRHQRIVPLENAARQAFGMPVLQPAPRHFSVNVSDAVPASDSVTAVIGRGMARASGRVVQARGHSHGTSSTSGNLSRVGRSLTIAYDILGDAASRRASAAEVRERFVWDAAATGFGSGAGATLWALTQQDATAGAFVGGVIGYVYGVILWRRTAE